MSRPELPSTVFQLRGHRAPVGERLWFRTEDVELAIAQIKSVVGVVDYGHIYKILSGEATSPDEGAA